MNQLAKPNKNALATMAGRLQINEAKLAKTLKDTAFKGASESEFAALVIVSNEFGLNPLLKQIYAFPAKGGGGGIVPLVSIDGWLHIINAHPQYDGMTCQMSEDNDGMIATCSIYRKDRDHPTVVSEYLSECSRQTEPWQQMPRRMLRHKAIIQAARVAFGFSGIYDVDEADQAQPIAATTATVEPPAPIDPFANAPDEIPMDDKPKPEVSADDREQEAEELI